MSVCLQIATLSIPIPWDCGTFWKVPSQRASLTKLRYVIRDAEAASAAGNSSLPDSALDTAIQPKERGGLLLVNEASGSRLEHCMQSGQVEVAYEEALVMLLSLR